MVKIVKITLVLLLIAAMSFAGWHGYRYFRSGPDSAEPRNFVTVMTGDIESVVTAQGKLEPKDYVDVGAQVSGKIEKLHVEIGDPVRAGDLIAEIDPVLYETMVAADEARLKTLEAQRAEKSAQVKQAQQKLERNRTLIQARAISQEVFEDAGTALEVARAQLMSLEAQIEEARSTLEGDRANLNYTKIYAPRDGTVVSQSTKEGQTINSSQTAPVIVQIANLDVMTVRAQVAEADITKLRPDMPVYFTTMGSQGRKWEGAIRQILPTPETVNDVVLYNVLVDVENKDGLLMTGMTTQMFFVLGRAQNVAIVPVGALTRRVAEADTARGKAYEVRVLDGRAIVPRTVMTGFMDRTRAEVVSGLNVGDRVAVPDVSAPATSQDSRPRMPRL